MDALFAFQMLVESQHKNEHLTNSLQICKFWLLGFCEFCQSEKGENFSGNEPLLGLDAFRHNHGRTALRHVRSPSSRRDAQRQGGPEPLARRHRGEPRENHDRVSRGAPPPRVRRSVPSISPLYSVPSVTSTLTFRPRSLPRHSRVRRRLRRRLQAESARDRRRGNPGRDREGREG